ncbi:MAG TPA: M23 family metallopeptidase [Burkholderiaceae bacterium]
MRPSPVRLLLIRLLFATLLLAALGLFGPYLEHALYAMRLGAMRVPQQVQVPVAAIRRADLRSTWRAPRGASRKHEGIDIFARRGTPVLAATEGIVLRTGLTRLGGKVVWVLGPGGQRHYYAHLDRYGDVGAGQRVDAGAVLGYVGTTGNAAGTPPHLHYGIYTLQGAVDPFPQLKSLP